MTDTLIDNIEWYRGDSYPAEILVTSAATGDPIDLTGYLFTLTVNSSKNPVDESEKMFEVLGDVNVDPTTGKVSFTPTATDTDLDPKTYYYDIEMRDPAGHIRTIAKFKWKIIQDITK